MAATKTPKTPTEEKKKKVKSHAYVWVAIALGIYAWHYMTSSGGGFASMQSSQTATDSGRFLITEEWSVPVMRTSRIRFNVGGNTTRDDLWHEVQIDGGPTSGGHQFPVPPWSTWESTGWTPPTIDGNSIRWRLLPGMNGDIHSAWFQYQVQPAQ